MIFSAEVIQPYVNLITWQVVALVGGVFFAPAIYLMAFRMKSVSVFGASADLSREDANLIESEVEQKFEDRAQQPNGAVTRRAEEELDDITNAPAGSQEQMYENVVSAQLALSDIVRSLAKPHGGENNLKAFKRNLEIVGANRLLPKDEIDRLMSLYDRRFAFRRDPASLTKDAYKSYMRSARRTTNRLVKKMEGTSPGEIALRQQSEPAGLPN